MKMSLNSAWQACSFSFARLVISQRISILQWVCGCQWSTWACQEAGWEPGNHWFLPWLQALCYCLFVSGAPRFCTASSTHMNLRFRSANAIDTHNQSWGNSDELELIFLPLFPFLTSYNNQVNLALCSPAVSAAIRTPSLYLRPNTDVPVT